MSTHQTIARAITGILAAAVACGVAHGQTVLVDASTEPTTGSAFFYVRGVLSSEFEEVFAATGSVVHGVRIHRHVGGTLEFQTRLATPPDIPLGSYGAALAVHGDTLMVGAPTSDLPGVPWNGRVLVHRRSEAGEWDLAEILMEPAPAGGDFGFNITLGDHLALIDECIYEQLEGGAWSFVDRLPLAAQDYVAAAIEGQSIFLSNGTEGVVEYQRDGGGTLVAVRSAVPKFVLQSSFNFGRTFALDGDRMVIGSTVVPSGMASVFKREFDGDWEHVQDIFAPAGTTDFAMRVAIAGTRILISGQRVGAFTGENGVAHAYRELGPWTWGHFADYQHPQPFHEDNFAASFSSSGDSFLVFNRGGGSMDESLHLIEVSDLLASNVQVSLSQFGDQWLYFRPDPSFAGAYFALLGSASGTSPGLDVIPGVVLPLVSDAYFIKTATGLGPFNDGQGWIDSEARAAVRLVVPNGTSPSLAGMVIHHAFLAYSPTTGAFTASRAVALELVP